MKKTNTRKIVIRRMAKKILTCTAKRITFYALVAIVTLVGLSSCNAITDYQEKRACVAVLELCERDGILDKAGIEAFHKMTTVEQYDELICECEEEECFDDVIAGTDEYEHYLDVLGYSCTEEE